MPPTAYSGADLKARDKAIVEKHEKEKAVLEARYQRLRHGFDALSNENCDLQNRGENAATKLGFRSFAEMVAILRVSGDQVPYTKLVEHVENLEGRLANEEGKVETIRAERDDALEEKVLLHTELMEAREQAAKSKVLAEELHQTLEAAKERHKRADTEFKERFSKWRSFKRFMATEELQYKEKVKGLDEEQKDKERLELCLKRREKLHEMGLDGEEPGGNDLVEDDYEANSSPPPEPSQSVTPVRPSVPPSSSPQIVAPASNTKPNVKTPVTFGTRTPLTFVSPSDKTSSSVPKAWTKPSDIIDLSESQDPIVPPPSATLPPRIGTPQTVNVKPHPMFAPPKPKSPMPVAGTQKKKKRHSEAFVRPPDDGDDEEERPRKTRRYSSPVRRPLKSNVGARSLSPLKSPGRGRENRNGRHSPSKTSSRKNAQASSSKQTNDYSGFKGRGRYGKAAGGDDTINSSYAIDPVRNGGVNFQFAEVVRGKEDRRRLQAGDCESCRDYYEAIGPLPARLQPPLWRSPPTSPTKHTTHTCRHGHKNDREVAAHKQAISRHREEWAQGSTPPGYWDIGFPTTQEADDINARAKEMHKQKMNRVREDAEGGGRYYKTR